MEITDKVQYVDVALLKKSNKNPRTIKNRNFAKLCDSIKEDPKYMELRPVLCDKNYEIYAGNQRYSACLVLGWKQIPCIVSDIPQEVKEARMLKDNLHSGEFDYGMLKDNFDKALLDDLFDEEILEDNKTEDDKPKDSKYVEQMELKNFESYDYLVFLFRDSRTYINVLQKFGIGKVDSSFSPKIKKIGVGRIVDGEELAKIIGHQSSDNKQG